jgi:glycine C-acetyltransferase
MRRSISLFGSRSEFLSGLSQELADAAAAGTRKVERVITSPQAAHIKVQKTQKVLNFCANNYLGNFCF